MTTEYLIGFMEWVHNGCIDFGCIDLPDPIDCQAIREAFVKESPRECLNTLIYVLDTQVGDVKYSMPGDELGLTIEAAELLGICGRIIPSEFLSKIQPILQDDKARSIVISGMHNTMMSEVVERLSPLVAEVEKLSEIDIIALIDAIGEVRIHNSAHLLEELQNKIPTSMTYAHNEILIFQNSADASPSDSFGR